MPVIDGVKVLLGRLNALLLTVQCMWVCAGDPTMPFKFLDNAVYDVSRPPEILAAFDRRFPPPPMFPPPPPSWREDQNALLREVIFSGIRDTIQKGLQGMTDLENRLSAGPKSGTDTGFEYLTTDIPACVEMSTLATTPRRSIPDSKPIPGPPGAQGPAGIAGEVGKPGKRGKRGRPGVKGPPGPAGESVYGGPVGVEGPPGIPGFAGQDGPEGPHGPRGHKGPRGHEGKQGHIGKPGHQGTKGEDGIPGLIIFPDAQAMHGVALEGLIAYRSDTKQLYFRDHITWRTIKVTRCGDGVIDRDVGERCDDANEDASDTCINCQKAFCGDGFIHAGQEECDGRNFDGKSCSTLRRGMVGALSCTSRCTISFARCRYPHR